ncbi:TPA: nucleotide sugar dehydrogenase [Candidatus Peribacteria bacterium]|nr:nucleotide sugar dehydrogenase [Candidatus Peribacteria bacterium]
MIGLGYVGLTLATVMAGVGFCVLGVEVRADVLKKIKKGKPHFFEPGLEGRLSNLIKKGRIQFSKRIPKDWDGTVFIITVGTPLGTDEKLMLEYIEGVGRQVAKHIKKDDMVIMRSTVKIGTTRNLMYPILKEAGVDFDLAFCPERTLEGKALIELRQLPQIVGGIEKSAAIRASQLFQFLTPTVIRVSNVETAEMVKLIDNANRDIMFGYANEVARACDSIGISALEVIQAGKLGYTRTNIPLPGLVGGPCLRKDPYILAEGIRKLGIEMEMTMTARKINERQPLEIVKYIKQQTSKIKGFPEKPEIALLGLAFKGQPSTDDLRGTMARPVFSALQKCFPSANFRGYDTLVKADEIKRFGLKPSATIEEALSGVNVAVILNNHIEYVMMPIETLFEKMARPNFIYDVWHLFDARELNIPEGCGYVALGGQGIGKLPYAQ